MRKRGVNTGWKPCSRGKIQCPGTSIMGSLNCKGRDTKRKKKQENWLLLWIPPHDLLLAEIVTGRWHWTHSPIPAKSHAVNCFSTTRSRIPSVSFSSASIYHKGVLELLCEGKWVTRYTDFQNVVYSSCTHSCDSKGRRRRAYFIYANK